MGRQISTGRKALYYVGMALIVLGCVSFASTFVTFAMHFGEFHNFESNARSIMFRAFGGMALMVVGAIILNLGAHGAAGSGVVLDPEQARNDLEPYSRMAGGMLKDALDEADLNFGGRAERVVMIKCPACGKLNEEDSKFCQECGKEF
jgi:hypothetical protein